jgi:hypothetical protein
MTLTPEQQAIFANIFARFPKCVSVGIAGGAVVDLNKASDIDLFFGNNNLVPVHTFLRSCDSAHLTGGQKYKDHITAYAEAWIKGIPLPIQVMTTGYRNMDELLAGFDISTHQWAYSSRGVLVKGKDATESTDLPVILFPYKNTLSRYIKICNRYGHPVDESTMLAIKMEVPDLVTNKPTSKPTDSSWSSASIPMNTADVVVWKTTDSNYLPQFKTLKKDEDELFIPITISS